MAAVSISPAFHLLPLLLLFLLVTNEGATLNITNQCSYTVWPAAVPLGGGMQLDPGKWWTLGVPAGTAGGRVWARTGCIFDANGNGSCQTGDCGGELVCARNGQPPNTVAEFALGQFNNTDVFNISLVLGFNVPMEFLPVPTHGGPDCSKWPRCVADITSQCPSNLKVPGGCNNACTRNRSNSCKPTTYLRFFKQLCPDAYSYPKDYSSSTFTCPTGTNYQVVFCPPINPSSLLPSPSASIPTRKTSIGSPSDIGISFRAGLSVMSKFLLARTILGCIFYLIYAYIHFVLRKRRHQVPEGREEEFGNLKGTPMRLTFQQLDIATEQFREKLGEGGFGSVFEGQLGDERIAVKRLDHAGHGEKEFLAEVHTIGSIHHINLVRLIGFCAEKSRRLLVYEYMAKGSLDRWIYCRHNSNAPLDWRTRCKIIANVAKGLSYLHEECTKRIVHLDIKPQNILLDENFNAKISDFGLCKLIDRDMSEVVTRMRGTPGYLAPEWLTSQITEKADVYSFGVVVMEIISGRKNLDTSQPEESIHLITLLEEKVKSDQLADLVDKQSDDMQVNKQEVIRMMRMAMWCLQIDCKKRPKMSEVVKVLEGTINTGNNIDYKFVATTTVNFGVAGDACSSAPPLASDVSGPR
ncbi:probable receptor-like protein kinase At5g20050 [Aegilops tauschii subsp. strangulata]|nr:PR5-like receptor kinase [Aegilops tauschii subsp. strangulata]